MNSWSVERFAEGVGEYLEAAEAEVVDAAFGLRNRAVGVAEPEASPCGELAGVLLDDVGDEVVDADGPVVGLGSSEELGAGDAVAEHGEVDAHGVHRGEFRFDLAVSGRRGDAEGRGARGDELAVPDDDVGKLVAGREVVGEVLEVGVGVDVNLHRASFFASFSAIRALSARPSPPFGHLPQRGEKGRDGFLLSQE